MPFYEYHCAACGRHHEELQKVGARPLRQCPHCGRTALKRLVSAPVFRLKGGGWYETDFKADKEQKRNLAGDKEPAPADSAPIDKSKDAKPEAGSKETKAKSGADGKPSAADAGPKAAGERSTPSRKTTARRRARK